jgi:tetratricopeptide (TPR) repeat protein
MRDFLECVKLAPENGLRRLSLGDAYLKLGRPEDALREYREGRRLLERELVSQPDDLALRATLAMALAKSGEFERALAEIERCAAARPERQADALHDLAKALALCGERERALDAIRTLVQVGYSKCLLRAEEEFASLRAEPGFRSLLSSNSD